ncbi:hypothetical protein KY328_01365 [Candidatus Woesearchaeota archaeon]|nr:hypothetical protein [Candidatus Woesearchaeota archaeon]
MEKYQEAREAAKKHIKTADHMISVTYPLVNDPKLLLAVMDNIFLSLTSSMAAILYNDRLFKRIPPFHNTFESKYRMFREKAVELHSIDKSYLKFILDIKNIIVQHKKSPVEFSRKDSFVICSEDYKMRTLTIPEIKAHIDKTKTFVELMERIVNKYDRLFK